jgi:hypothetical protein
MLLFPKKDYFLGHPIGHDLAGCTGAGIGYASVNEKTFLQSI